MRLDMQEVCDGISSRLCDSESYIEDIESRISQFDSILSRRPDTESTLKDLGSILVAFVPPTRRRRSWGVGKFDEQTLQDARALLEHAHTALMNIKVDRVRQLTDLHEMKAKTELESLLEMLNIVLGNIDTAIEEIEQVWFPDWYGPYQHFCCFEAA
jgi:hypothetical protein